MKKKKESKKKESEPKIPTAILEGTEPIAVLDEYIIKRFKELTSRQDSIQTTIKTLTDHQATVIRDSQELWDRIKERYPIAKELDGKDNGYLVLNYPTSSLFYKKRKY